MSRKSMTSGFFGILGTLLLVSGFAAVEAGLPVIDRSVDAVAAVTGGFFMPMVQSGGERVRFMAAAADTAQFEEGLVLSLGPNAPNPFSEQTEIVYTLDEDRAVRLVFYDAFYNTVEVLVDANQLAGPHRFTFFPRGRYASGMYFYSLEVEGQERQTRRMILMR